MKPVWRKLHPTHPMVLEVARLRVVVRQLRAETRPERYVYAMRRWIGLDNQRPNLSDWTAADDAETDAMCGEDAT